MMKARLIAAAAVATAAGVAAPADAAPVVVGVYQDLATGPFSFTVDGATFTFSGTGDLFNPVAVMTGGSGAVNSFGGFLGIPIAPTSDFIDRGDVAFGPGDQFTAFSRATPVPSSNGDNYIGLRAGTGNALFYGFAYTTDTVLNFYGFETAPYQAIAATASVPEPAVWTMLIVGFGAIGGAVRYRRRTVRVAFS